MSKKRVRMIDVATAAGVSRTTASFVLNGRDAGIPDETRDRVLEMARQMKYTPHAAARNLATGKTHRFGVVLYNSHHFAHLSAYHHQLLTSIMAAASQYNQNVLLHSATYKNWRELASDILSGVSDGVLLIGRETHDALTLALLEHGFPTVCISYNIADPRCYTVDCDNVGGAYSAIRHLLQSGHRRIIFASMGEQYSWEQERLQGAGQAVCDAGLPAETLVHAPLSEMDIEDYIRRQIKPRLPEASAIYVSDEWAAQYLIEHLPEHGITIPQNLAVVCFNSTEISARTRPPATSVWQPLEEIGTAAVDMLVSLIEKRDVPQRSVRFPTRLDVRESSETT